jgi:asparagine synthase (glutamine-hydrolysing)
MSSLTILSSGAIGPYEDKETGCLLSYNGEVYNWRELARAWGIQLTAGSSDAQVVMDGYLRMGAEFLRELDGMFAIAIYDPRDQTLLLARDRFGEKPLYWARDGNTVAFASEVKAVHVAVPTTPIAPPGWLVFETPLGPETPWAEVSLLPPGTVLTVDARTGGARQREYWRLPDLPVADQADFDHDRFAALLHDAMQSRRPSEPMALALSGGLDSAVLAYGMWPEMLVTVQYPGHEQLDERKQAELVAADLGSELVVLQPTVAEFQARAPELVEHLDYPVGNASLFSELLLYEAVAERGIRVVAGGIGPDELLLGYVRHRLILEGPDAIAQAGDLRSYRPMAARFAALTAEHERTAERYFRLIQRGLDIDPSARRLVFEQFKRAGDIGQALTLTDLATSFPPLQLTSDKLSSAFGLEHRSPYLARSFAEYCYSQPVAIKSGVPSGTKAPLREAARRLGVPAAIWRDRSKRGFGSPVPNWLARELNPWCRAHLAGLATDTGAPPLARLMARRASQLPGEAWDRAIFHALLVALWWSGLREAGLGGRGAGEPDAAFSGAGLAHDWHGREASPVPSYCGD